MLAHFFEPLYTKAVCSLEKLKGSRQVDGQGWREGGRGGREGSNSNALYSLTHVRAKHSLPFPPSLPPSLPPLLTVSVQILEEGEEDRVPDVRQDHLALTGLFHPAREAGGREGGREGGRVVRMSEYQAAPPRAPWPFSSRP